MMKPLSPAELLSKAAAYCATAEHCPTEVEQKLHCWGAEPDAASAILSRLMDEGFIDERRYCHAFVSEKWHANRWGKQKMAQALRLRKLPKELIFEALDEIDNRTYHHVLRSLLAAKERGIKARNNYERKGKLLRFALSRGFEQEVVMECLHRWSDDDESSE